DVLAAARSALEVPRDILGDGCITLAATLAADARFTSREIWSWARLGSDANLPLAVLRYVSLLPATEQPTEATLDAVMDKTASWLAHRLGESVHGQEEPIVLALARLARTEPRQTAQLFERSWSAALNADARAYVWAQIGAAASKKQQAEATD